jgi:methylated-DNA-protein-cysteine methyltransferase-like protein
MRSRFPLPGSIFPLALVYLVSMAVAMFSAILTQVRRIPRGKVATYGDVAYAAGFPGAARQVVWALHSARGLPWHRVVGAGGQIKLTGEHAFEQRMRLQAEGVTFRGQRIAMDVHHHSFFATAKKKTGAIKNSGAQQKSSPKKNPTAKKSPAKKKSTKNRHRVKRS